MTNGDIHSYNNKIVIVGLLHSFLGVSLRFGVLHHLAKQSPRALEVVKI